MATFEVTSPTGEKYEVTAPDGATEDQVLSYAKQQFQKAAPSKLTRFMKGMKDPIDAGAQLLSRSVPESVTNVLDYLPNKMRQSDSPLLQTIGETFFADPRQNAVDQSIKNSEYNIPGVDWMRLAGNVASPVNAAVASRLPQAATGLGRIGVGTGAGAIGGLLTPVTDGDFSKEKAKQVGMGAAGGALMSTGVEGLSRVVNPNVRPGVRTLLDEGITPTPGQILGGAAQTTEDKLTSIPILGDAITSARKKGIDELNEAVYKRVLNPIGGQVPKGVGREAVADVADQVSNAYDNLLPNLTFKADTKFAQDLSRLQQMASGLPDEQANRFEKVLRDTVIKKLGPQGTMDGIALKGVESDLGELARGLRRDALFDNRQLGNAIGEVQQAIRDNLIRTNPDQAAELKSINTAFANLARLRKAAGSLGADEGAFTAPQLQSAVKALDPTKGKGGFAKGTALMQDLSDPAKAILPSKYPDSGTPGRVAAGLLTGGLASGGALLSPSIGGPAVAVGLLGTVPYLPGGRQAMAALLARRPDAAQQIAEVIRQAGPLLAPAGAALLKPAEQ